MTTTPYCSHTDCYAILGVKFYERTAADCLEDADGRQLGEGERVFAAIEPIALCSEHAGNRKPVRELACGDTIEFCQGRKLV